MRWKCITCNGTYSDTQADGTLYFHACAPIGTTDRGRAIERPNKRDENLVLDEHGRQHGIKAEGRGRTQDGES